MKPIFLSEIWTYPVKSFKGISSIKGLIDERGFVFDRRWMIVDDRGVALTQREFPAMALIETQLNEESLELIIPGMDSIHINIDSLNQNQVLLEVQVWEDVCQAVRVSYEADEYLSIFLKTPCSLVFMPDTFHRVLDSNYAPEGSITGFADAFPFLLISEASLADLNNRLENPVPMNRFRPNLVISGTDAFEEDTWKTIRIGNIIFEVVKPCTRCVLTTIEQSTAIQGKEPLQTLSKYRKFNNKVLFGQNLVHRQIGELKVGYSLEVIGRK